MLFFCTSHNSLAQQRFEGYLRHETGLQHTGDQQLIFSRNSIQTNFQYSSSAWQLRISPQLQQDLLENQPSESTRLRLREAFIEIFAADWDIRLGRQLITSSSPFANPAADFFAPFDFSEFLAQDPSDAQLGITAANFRYFRSNNTFQLVIVPVFEASILPPTDSRWNLLPLDALTGGLSVDNAIRNAPGARNLQSALTWENRSFLQWDFNITAFYGYYPVPSLRKSIVYSANTGLPENVNLRYHYDKAAAIRGSMEYRSQSNLILSSDLTLWSQRAFDTFPVELRGDTEISLPELIDLLNTYDESRFQSFSPLFSGMWSAQRTILSTTVLMSYQLDYILNNRLDILQERAFHSLQLVLSRSMLDDFLQARVIGIYQVNGADFWINPDLTYTLFDGLTLAAGSQFFAGRNPDPLYAHLSFHQFRQNSFSYVKLTAYW